MPRKQTQQCGLARAVLGYDSDLVSFVDTKGYRVKEHTVAIALGQVFDLKIRFHQSVVE